MRKASRAKISHSCIGRRQFLKKLGATVTAAGITGIVGPFEFASAAINPGEKGIYITNIYRTQISSGGGWGGGWAGVIIRIETNKGIVGYGECRDLDDERARVRERLSLCP